MIEGNSTLKCYESSERSNDPSKNVTLRLSCSTCERSISYSLKTAESRFIRPLRLTKYSASCAMVANSSTVSSDTTLHMAKDTTLKWVRPVSRIPHPNRCANISTLVVLLTAEGSTIAICHDTCLPDEFVRGGRIATSRTFFQKATHDAGIRTRQQTYHSVTDNVVELRVKLAAKRIPD